jgi:hypothetical protein
MVIVRDTMAKRKRNITKQEIFHSKAYYFGTTKGNSFWKRCKTEELFERGLGELWLTRDTLYFRRYLTIDPIKIPTRAITSISYGYGHAGKLSAQLVFKVHWSRKDFDLTSGFSTVKKSNEFIQWERSIKKLKKA